MYSSLLHCLNKRKAYLNCPSGWRWVLRDPVVMCFSPALYQLEKDGEIQLSSEEHTTYENLYWQNTVLNVRRQHKLHSTLEKLANENIEVIPLKGAALLETIFKNVGLRVMTDVDILVRQEVFLQTAELLQNLGLQPKWSYPSGDIFEFVTMPVKYWPGELSFSDGEGLHVDLHSDLVTYHWFKVPFPLDMEILWKRALQLQGPSASGEVSLWKTYLSSYDMLAHMCLHLALHGIQILKNLWDVDLFLRTLPEDWDWRKYIEIAEISGLKSASYHAFLFCQEIFKTHIPEYVMHVLQPAGFDCWQVRKLITPQDLISNKNTLGKRYPTLVKFALFDNTNVKLRTIKNLVITDSDWLEHQYLYRNIFGHWHHILRVLLRGD